MKKLKVLSAVAASMIALSIAAMPAFADPLNSNNVKPGTTSSIAVQLNAEAATFSVTVPTSIAVHIAADGTVTGGTTTVTNNSSAAVVVTNAAITAASGWEIGGFDSILADIQSIPAGTNRIGYTVNSGKTLSSGAFDFSQSNFPRMNKANTADDSDTLTITYDAIAPARTREESNTAVSELVLTLDWYDGANEQLHS